MSRHLYAIHDPSADWTPLIRDAGMTGWAVISEEIGDDPNNHSGHDYSDLAAYGVTPLVRLNYSHHGAGTIPLPNRYSAFSERCANFVTASPGCRHWIIGNEPNLRAERYGDVPITPGSYAECFNLCRTQILHRDTQNQVMPAAIAPYNADTGWCLDYWREMLSAIVMNDSMADGLALHTYSRGGNPASITSEDKMDAPYQSCYNGFRAYRDFLELVPAIMRALPVYITETDQLEPWADSNSGWVQAAYAEIDGWNAGTGHQSIHCLALYRWQNYDQWGFCQKNGVIDDFRHALAYGYAPTMPTPPTPPTPEPTPPQPQPEPSRDIDPALYERGVTFDFATVPAGSGYWRISKAEWLDEADADAAGPDHHILGEVLKDGRETAGVPLRVDWPSGDTIVTSKADDPNAGYNYDYPMSKSLNEYSIVVADGAPSDIATGIGMGKDGNAGIHTSTWITFEWQLSSSGLTPPLLPPLTPVTGHLVWPVTGPITQEFGEGGPQFGQVAHNGIDIGCPEGTPVQAIADGEVMYTGFDDDYGNYCRVYHEAIHSHSFYAHLQAVGAQVGQLVRQGDWLGASGNTGNSTGPHLHMEMRAGNRDAYYEGVTFGYTHGKI
jgi:hypothetical protein